MKTPKVYFCVYEHQKQVVVFGKYGKIELGTNKFEDEEGKKYIIDRLKRADLKEY